ncbi:MAG: LBF_2804 family protein [Bacteroidia bacterium]
MLNSIYHKFFTRLPLRPTQADKTIHLLSAEEFQSIRKLERKTIFISALIGAVMVLVLYFPQYYWSSFFGESHFNVFGFEFDLSITSLVWGILLVFVEIMMLSILHLYCAHETAVAIGLIRTPEHKQGPDAKALIDIGLERKDKSLLRFGLDPYQGLSKTTVFLITLFVALKATLSNVLVKLITRRLLGRYALREVLDMLGIPIFAFWNAWATRIVLRETRVSIMGRHALIVMENQLREKINPEHHEWIYDSLQYVAICKRDYHRNHALLSQMLIQKYEIDIRTKHHISEEFIEEIQLVPEDVADLCRIIMVLGLVLDGKISIREKRRMKMLMQTGWLHCSETDLDQWSEQFRNGEGLQSLFDRYPKAFRA